MADSNAGEGLHLRAVHLRGALWIALGVALCGAAALGVATRRHPYRRADILGYLPAECPAARIYVDVAGMWKAAGSDDLLSSARQGHEFGSLIAAFDAAGIDIVHDVRDFALCAADFGDEESRGDVQVALGGSLGGEGALARYKSIVETLSHVDPSSVVEEKRSGVPYLVSKLRLRRVWIAMPAPDVLVFSTADVSKIDTLRRAHSVEVEAWQAQSDTIAGFDYVPPDGAPAGTRLRGRITSAGDVVVLDAAARSTALEALDAAKLEAIRSATVAALDRSVLRPLSEPVRDMTWTLAQGQLQVRLRVPGAVLRPALVRFEQEPQVVLSILSDLTR